MPSKTFDVQSSNYTTQTQDEIKVHKPRLASTGKDSGVPNLHSLKDMADVGWVRGFQESAAAEHSQVLVEPGLELHVLANL